MDTHVRLMERVGEEQDDVLAALQLVRGDEHLEDRLFHQLVSLLCESMFLELRQQHLGGELERDAYVEQVCELSRQCREQGLLTSFAAG